MIFPEEPVEVTTVSTGKAEYPCKCRKSGEDDMPKLTLHRKEVLSDGWTRWVCLKCGQVKFSRGGGEAS